MHSYLLMDTENANCQRTILRKTERNSLGRAVDNCQTTTFENCPKTSAHSGKSTPRPRANANRVDRHARGARNVRSNRQLFGRSDHEMALISYKLHSDEVQKEFSEQYVRLKSFPPSHQVNIRMCSRAFVYHGCTDFICRIMPFLDGKCSEAFLLLRIYTNFIKSHTI